MNSLIIPIKFLTIYEAPQTPTPHIPVHIYVNTHFDWQDAREFRLRYV